MLKFRIDNKFTVYLSYPGVDQPEWHLIKRGLCHKKQSIRNRSCSWGNDLVAAKRTKKVRYWVNYRLPGGKQRREPVSFSLEEARAAEDKRKAQQYENPGILEKVPAEKMTFTDPAD
jgi:hypothetical protein